MKKRMLLFQIIEEMKGYFEDLIVWQESVNVYNTLYNLFPKKKVEDYFFRDQGLRAGLLISNNIAEGHERHTNKELSHFLYIAKGSCGEVRSMLHIAMQNGLIYSKKAEALIGNVKKISIMLWKLIQSKNPR